MVLIVIGGDGSMKILKSIADKGELNIVAIPKTIDNDVGATENSIGLIQQLKLQPMH